MRTKGTGSIKPKGDGKWLVRWTDNDADGSAVQRSKQINGNKKAAEDYLAGVTVAKKRAEYAAPTALKLGDYLAEWIAARRASKKKICERTVCDYEDAIRRYVLPTLGEKRIDDLKPADFRKLYTGMLAPRSEGKRGPGARTVAFVHHVLRAALNAAVRENLLAANPVVRASDYVPEQTKQRRPVLSFDEVVAFRTAASSSGHAAFFDFLLQTGCRPSEALALKWTDVDLDAGIAGVERTLSRPGRAFELRAPKTELSKRTLGLSSELCKALRGHKAEQAERMMRLRDVWEDLGLVFPGPLGGFADVQQINRRAFKTVCRKAKLSDKLSLYCLRHSFASLALADGAKLHEVSDAMGHANTRLVLETYGHALPKERAAVFTRMGERIFASGG